MPLSENERKVLAEIERDFLELETRRRRRRRRRFARVASLVLDVLLAVVVAITAVDALPAAVACALTGLIGLLVGFQIRAAWRKDEVTVTSQPRPLRTHRSDHGRDRGDVA